MRMILITELYSSFKSAIYGGQMFAGDSPAADMPELWRGADEEAYSQGEKLYFRQSAGGRLAWSYWRVPLHSGAH